VSTKGSQFALLDLIVVPVQRWSWTVPVPEEDVALRLATLSDIVTRETFVLGRQTMRGSVSFGKVRLALVRRDGVGIAWPDTPDNPALYQSVLVIRGSIEEIADLTHVRLWVYPGSTLAAILAGPAGMMIGFGYAWYHGLLSVVWPGLPLVLLVAFSVWFVNLRRDVRREVGRMLGA
jgi:hypothetical protein